LHDGKDVQEPLTDPEADDEKEHEQAAHPHVARGWLIVGRPGFHATPPVIRRVDRLLQIGRRAGDVAGKG
jgi:hypothetical protein